MPKPDEPIGKTSPEDWKPGDDAICVKHGAWQTSPHGFCIPGPKKGSVYKVVDLDLDDSISCQNTGGVYIGLVFREYPHESWCSCCFSKLRPLGDDEKREFEADLRHDERVGDLVADIELIEWRTGTGF